MAWLRGRGNAVRGIKFGHQDQGAVALWPRARQWREVCQGVRVEGGRKIAGNMRKSIEKLL